MGEEYFKLLQLFLNCQQYMSEKEFNVIADIKNLRENLEEFIINISKYSDFAQLPEEMLEILLEILISSINLYVSINPDKASTRQFLREVFY